MDHSSPKRCCFPSLLVAAHTVRHPFRGPSLCITPKASASQQLSFLSLILLTGIDCCLPCQQDCKKTPLETPQPTPTSRSKHKTLKFTLLSPLYLSNPRPFGILHRSSTTSNLESTTQNLNSSSSQATQTTPKQNPRQGCSPPLYVTNKQSPSTQQSATQNVLK